MAAGKRRKGTSTFSQKSKVEQIYIAFNPWGFFVKENLAERKRRKVRKAARKPRR